MRYGYDLDGVSGYGYEFDGFSYRSAPADPVPWAAAAGGVSASARGLVDFDCALFHRPGALTSFLAAARPGVRLYRWGWFAECGPFGDIELYHDGINGGFRAFNVYLPKSQLAVAVISNTSTFNSWQVAHELIALLNGEHVRIPGTADLATFGAAWLSAMRVEEVSQVRYTDGLARLLTEEMLAAMRRRTNGLGNVLRAVKIAERQTNLEVVNVIVVHFDRGEVRMMIGRSGDGRLSTLAFDQM